MTYFKLILKLFQTYKLNRELRTEYSTVPPQAFKDATSLFVREVMFMNHLDQVVSKLAL